MEKIEGTTLFLSSLESERFSEVRKCEVVKLLRFTTGKECALVRLSPGVIGQPWGVAEDLEVFVITPRHEGHGLTPIVEFPCFVHLARIVDHQVERLDEISNDQVQNIAWCELYRTESDAENHVFD